MKYLLKFPLLCLAFIAFINTSDGQNYNQANEFLSANDVENIATKQEQVLKMEEWLKWRKSHVVPKVMRRYEVDMWIITHFEGPLFYSLAPANYDGCISERYEAMILIDKGEKGIEELTAGFDELEKIIKSKKPRRIAIADDASDELKNILSKKLVSKFYNSEDLRTGFLESRTPEELSVFEHVCRVAYEVIAEAFSNKVIIPDVTTTDDLNWWIRQRYAELGLGTSDHPTITIQRSKTEQIKYSDGPEHFNIEIPPRNGYNKVIRRGDIISCDTGIDYFGLGTDTQQNAYVLKEGETDVPAGLELAMENTNKLQSHFAAAFEVGKPANDIVNDALKAAFADGLRPAIYSHPIPYYLLRFELGGRIIHRRYMEGPEFYAGELEEPVPFLPTGGYEVQENTVYAMELHCWTDVPEWNNQKVRLVLETNVALKKDGIEFLGGRQTKWHIIR